MSYPPRPADSGLHSSAEQYSSVPLSESFGTPELGSYNDESPRPGYHNRQRSVADTLMSEPDPFASQTGLHARSANYAGAATPEPMLAGEKLGRRRHPQAGAGWWGSKSRSARKWLTAALVALIVIIIVAVAVPVAVTQSHSSSTSNKAAAAASSSSTTTSIVTAPAGVPTGSTGSTDWSTAATGGHGSTVFLSNGSSFVYNNTFGGFWNAIPFNDSAQAQADVPALSEEWDYDTNLIQGVNIGG